MSTEVQETATSETPTTEAQPKTIREHYAAAKAAQSIDQDSPTAGDDTKDSEQPTQETEKTADESLETVESSEDTLLTDEEVSKLKGKELDLYKKAQANFTRKNQAIAEERRQMEQWQPTIKALQSNPEAVYEELGRRLGKTATAKTDTKSETTETKDIPPELEFLRPLFEAREKQLEARIRAELAPVKETMDTMVSEAIAAETKSTIAQFEAKHPGWQKYEKQMLEIGSRMQPVAGQMNDFEYMEQLYTLARSRSDEAEKTKEVIAKIDRAVSRSEPSAPAVKDELVEHAIPPQGKRSMRDAYAAAKNGVRWTNP